MIRQTVCINASQKNEISNIANKYGISQQDAIRLAIQVGLKHLDDFLTKQQNTQDKDIKHDEH